MNDFTFHNSTDGWIETNIPHYVDLHLARLAVTSLGQGHSQRMSTWAHDKTPPPDYPYLSATSAHSAAVQLYARSGQLATADILKRRNRLGNDRCRLGCDATESPRHLFVNCPKYQEWMDETSKEILARTGLKADTFKVVGETKDNLMAAAKSLFTDSTMASPFPSVLSRSNTGSRTLTPSKNNASHHIWPLTGIHRPYDMTNCNNCNNENYKVKYTWNNNKVSFVVEQGRTMDSFQMSRRIAEVFFRPLDYEVARVARLRGSPNMSIFLRLTVFLIPGDLSEKQFQVM